MRPISSVFHINSGPQLTLNERFARLNKRGPNQMNTNPPIRRGGIQKYKPPNNRDMRGRINKTQPANFGMRTPPRNQNQQQQQPIMHLRNSPNRRYIRGNFMNRGSRGAPRGVGGFSIVTRGSGNIRGGFRGRGGGRGGRGGRQQQQFQSKMTPEEQKAMLDKDLESFMHTDN